MSGSERSFLRGSPDARTSARVFAVAVLAVCLAMTTALAQPDPSEHDEHHPGRSGPPETAGPPGMGMSGMGDGGMESMMDRMGVPPPRELFPEMMRIEEPTAEQRAALLDRARTRRLGGAIRLSEGLESLDQAVDENDRIALSEALGEARAGLDELESGLSAEQALAAGSAPPEVAIDWFRDEMRLQGSSTPEVLPLGIGWFHAFVMAILAAFSLAMIAMYFQKMRRASQLLAELSQAGAQTVEPTRSPPPSVSEAADDEPQRLAGPLPASNPVIFEALRKTGSCGSCKSPCATHVRVAQVVQETPDVKTFRLRPIDDGPLPFEYLPGQFLNVIVPSNTSEGATTKRSYTISSSPTQSTFCEISVKREPDGEVSTYLHDQVAQGDEIRIAAPYGRFTFTGEEATSIVLIGCGVGITPLMSVIRYLTDHSWTGEIVLLYGFRRPADYLFGEELAYLASRHPNLRVFPTASSPDDAPWQGRVGRIDAAMVRQLVPDVADRLVHICGPKPMMDATREFLLELGVAKDRIRFESFGGKSAKDGPIERPTKDALEAAHKVVFSRSQKTAEIPPGSTVLDVAESVDVEIDWSCRMGTCGICAAKLLEGSVEMEVDDGLDEEDRSAGKILTCQAKATSDIMVEA